MQSRLNVKPCKQCGKDFQQVRPMQSVCSPACASKSVRKAKKAEQEATKQQRKADRAKLESLKTLGELRKEAQMQFNRYIRARDRKAGYGCICCGAPLEWDSGMPGGSVDAGHYLSRGGSIELAFDERNVNAQRKSCNRPGGTTRERFRAGMVGRYGETIVAELEGPQDLPHLKADDLRRIRDEYRKRANDVLKSMGL
jgi:hypothetical protein